MASTTTTETWDAAWTLTMRAKRKRLTDNFFASYPTLEAFRSSGSLEMENGGKEIQEDILYAGNSAEYFSGYDVLNTDAVDGITAAFYPFRYASCPITINHVEEMENRKTDAPATTPTTLGGITVSGNSWWKNKTNNASGDTSFKTISNTNFYEGMLRMSTTWNDISEGNEQPTHIFTTNDLYGDFEEIFEGTGYQRITGKDTPGVDGRLPSFRGIPIQYDRDCGSGRMYFLNTNYLKLKMQNGMNFAKTPFREPANQMAKVAFIIVGLQLTTNNRRRQGVIYNLTA